MHSKTLSKVTITPSTAKLSHSAAVNSLSHCLCNFAPLQKFITLLNNSNWTHNLRVAILLSSYRRSSSVHIRFIAGQKWTCHKRVSLVVDKFRALASCRFVSFLFLHDSSWIPNKLLSHCSGSPAWCISCICSFQTRIQLIIRFGFNEAGMCSGSGDVLCVLCKTWEQDNKKGVEWNETETNWEMLISLESVN